MSVSTYDAEVIDAGSYGNNLWGVEIYDSRRFFSAGPNGRFELRTFITKIGSDPIQKLFNIGFGVWDEDEQKIDDKIQTRNEDFRRILGTVAKIALGFLEQYPDAHLYAEGSTDARTRLYQREILKVLDELPEGLTVYGFMKRDNVFVHFKRGINYNGFLLGLENY